MNNSLQEFLSQLQPGAVQDQDQRTVERLLFEVWPTIEGADSGGMQDYKLLGRTEKMTWTPPNLFYSIERHGGIVLGSTRAELQNWVIDTSSLKADISSGGHRQLDPMAKRLDVKPIADEIAELIVNNRESSKLKRFPDGRVQVLIGPIITGRCEGTETGRRKRFRAALESRISPHGWIKVGKNNMYKKTESEVV